MSFPSFVIAYFHLFSLSLLVPLYLPFCPYPSSVFVCLCTSLGIFSCVFLLSLYVSFFVHMWDCWIFFSLWFFCVVLFLLLFAGCSLGSPAAFSDPAKPSLLRLLLPVSLLKLSFVSSTLRVKLVHLCGIHPLHSTHLGYMQSHPFKAIFQYWFLLSLTIYTTSQSKHSLQL